MRRCEITKVGQIFQGNAILHVHRSGDHFFCTVGISYHNMACIIFIEGKATIIIYGIATPNSMINRPFVPLLMGSFAYQAESL